MRNRQLQVGLALVLSKRICLWYLLITIRIKAPLIL